MRIRIYPKNLFAIGTKSKKAAVHLCFFDIGFANHIYCGADQKILRGAFCTKIRLHRPEPAEHFLLQEEVGDNRGSHKRNKWNAGVPTLAGQRKIDKRAGNAKD